mgnify:CR=1 FL=1
MKEIRIWIVTKIIDSDKEKVYCKVFHSKEEAEQKAIEIGGDVHNESAYDF